MHLLLLVVELQLFCGACPVSLKCTWRSEGCKLVHPASSVNRSPKGLLLEFGVAWVLFVVFLPELSIPGIHHDVATEIREVDHSTCIHGFTS